MIVLGLLLILLAIGAGTVLFLATAELSDPVRLEAFNVRADVLPLGLLIAGAAVMFLLWLGLVLLRLSVRHKARRRRDARELQREAEARREAEERAQATTPVPAQRFAAGGADETRDTRADRSADRDTDTDTRRDERPENSAARGTRDQTGDENRDAHGSDARSARDTRDDGRDGGRDDGRDDAGTDPQPDARSSSDPTVADRVMHRDKGSA